MHAQWRSRGLSISCCRTPDDGILCTFLCRVLRLSLYSLELASFCRCVVPRNLSHSFVSFRNPKVFLKPRELHRSALVSCLQMEKIIQQLVPLRVHITWRFGEPEDPAVVLKPLLRQKVCLQSNQPQSDVDDPPEFILQRFSDFVVVCCFLQYRRSRSIF